MPAYYYSSTAGSYTLAGDVNASATILVLNSVTGLPTSVPFKVVVEPGQPSEEIVKVTAVAGTSLTVTRGWDGTSAAAHAAASAVRHMVTAEDFTLSRAHEDATAAHGATGAVVGTTNAQTLSNKNLTNGTNTFPTTLVTLTGSQTLTSKVLTSPVINTPTVTQAILKGNTADTADIFVAKNNAGTDLFKAEPGAINVGDGALLAHFASAWPGSAAVLELTCPDPLVRPLYIRAQDGQTAALIEARSKDELTTLFKVSVTGAITSPTILGLQADIGALEIATADSGWVNVSIASGKAGQNGDPPQVRKIGKMVHIRWGWANTGLTANSEIVVGTVPDGYRPPRTSYINMVGSTGNQYGMALINPAGVVSIRTASSLADYYLFPGELSGWFLD